jgi:dipeptidyl aminopeptidase/acylaminoacyl peptidase
MARMHKLLFAGVLAASATPAICSQSASAANADTNFLAFPLATEISAGKSGSFAWLVRQGEQTIVMFARAPDFKPVRLFSRTDVDGAPIIDVKLSPDGRYIVFQTAQSIGGGKSYNPASLVEPPKPTLWLISTSPGADPLRIGLGTDPFFSPEGEQLLYRHQGDLWSVAPDAAPEPKLLVAGGASFNQPKWTKDGKALVFVQDRGGYSFLGLYRLGSPQIEWLATGPDRIASPVVSPDGASVAYLQFGGREHDVVYDRTENEPFGVALVDLATGRKRVLWENRDKVGLIGLQDPDNGLRWVGNDRLAFYSEHDGWGRLYAVPRAGGAVRPLTPTSCEAAESEPAGAEILLVVHNCRDIDTRQMSLVNTRTGREQPLKIGDMVAANAAADESGRYLAFAGGDAEAAPLVRVLDLKSGKVIMAEKPLDYGYQRKFAAPAPRVVRFPAADGSPVPGQLFLPSGKGPHPALVYVHGGPSRQMFPGFHYSGYYASDFAINRRLAELGYVVLAVNYRSGIGYGRAFREAPGRGWRAASEYQDVLGAGRWLAARSDVDPGRIGIWGGSYGGLLTAQALARNSDLFKAGVAIHGVLDWSWPSAREGHLNPSRYFGVAEADRPTALKSSPLGAIDQWRSPVLLFSGDQDMNVDVLETVDLAQKLRARNVDVRTVLLPGEAHDFQRHQSRIRLWNEQSAFFAEKLDK